MRNVPPAATDTPSAEELAEGVLLRLLRGGTWEGLANEISWKAVRAAGADASCFEWLPGMVAAVLSERVDGLEFVLDRERDAAREQHLLERPHDVAGAETAATLAAGEEGARHVSRLYVDVLDWATAVLEERIAQAPGSRRSRRDRPSPEIPTLVAEALAGERPRYGWPSRRAA